jgi:hypothetical protein
MNGIGGLCCWNVYMISWVLIMLKEFSIKLWSWHLKQVLMKSTKMIFSRH